MVPLNVGVKIGIRQRDHRKQRIAEGAAVMDFLIHGRVPDHPARIRRQHLFRPQDSAPTAAALAQAHVPTVGHEHQPAVVEVGMAELDHEIFVAVDQIAVRGGVTEGALYPERAILFPQQLPSDKGFCQPNGGDGIGKHNVLGIQFAAKAEPQIEIGLKGACFFVDGVQLVQMDAGVDHLHDLQQAVA